MLSGLKYRPLVHSYGRCNTLHVPHPARPPALPADNFNWCSVPLAGSDAFLFVSLALLAAGCLFGKLSVVWVLITGGCARLPACLPASRLRQPGQQAAGAAAAPCWRVQAAPVQAPAGRPSLSSESPHACTPSLPACHTPRRPHSQPQPPTNLNNPFTIQMTSNAAAPL